MWKCTCWCRVSGPFMEQCWQQRVVASVCTPEQKLKSSLLQKSNYSIYYRGWLHSPLKSQKWINMQGRYTSIERPCAANPESNQQHHPLLKSGILRKSCTAHLYEQLSSSSQYMYFALMINSRWIMDLPTFVLTTLLMHWRAICIGSNVPETERWPNGWRELWKLRDQS